MTRELNRSVYDSLRLAPSAMGEVWNMSTSMDGTFEFNRDMLQESKVPLANPIHLCRAGSAAHFMDACIWERLASKDFASFGDRMKSVARRAAERLQSPERDHEGNTGLVSQKCKWSPCNRGFIMNGIRTDGQMSASTCWNACFVL
jgi:hypothetical protein